MTNDDKDLSSLSESALTYLIESHGRQVMMHGERVEYHQVQLTVHRAKYFEYLNEFQKRTRIQEQAHATD